MTAVIDAPATTVTMPTLEEWSDGLDNLDNHLWGGRAATATWLASQGREFHTLAGITPRQLAEAYQQGGFNAMPMDEESVRTFYSWVEEMLSQDPAPEEAAADALPNPATNRTIEQEIAEAIDAAGPHVWDSLARSFGPEMLDRWHGQIVEVIAYQVGNWKRGKQIRRDDHGRHQQFGRRFSKVFNQSLRYELDPVVLTVLSYMNKVVSGLEPERVTPLTPNASEVRIYLEREHADLEIQGMGTRALSMAAETLRHVILTVIRNGQFTEFEELDPEGDAWKMRLHDYSYDIGNLSTVEQRVTLYHIAKRYILPNIPERDYAPIEGLDSPEKVFAWLLELHPGISAFRVAGLTNGWADFVDHWKEHGEFKHDKDLVAALRRCVRQYGYAKFTGRAPRSVILRALEDSMGPLKGVGLTVEEWKARWARRDIAVSYVSGRYGELHGLCSVLEAATAELGIDPLRKPQVPVAFKGGGLEVVVLVETWKDDESALRTAAKTKWQAMSAKDRLAAVVKQENVHVNWGEMVAQ